MAFLDKSILGVAICPNVVSRVALGRNSAAPETPVSNPLPSEEGTVQTILRNRYLSGKRTF
jgi:hypothetical protein